MRERGSIDNRTPMLMFAVLGLAVWYGYWYGRPAVPPGWPLTKIAGIAVIGGMIALAIGFLDAGAGFAANWRRTEAERTKRDAKQDSPPRQE